MYCSNNKSQVCKKPLDLGRCFEAARRAFTDLERLKLQNKI